ncbi:hypothetical protein BJ165DRAFT_1448010 [Panaeolus papilionaceus]|nr:hypothetical protein BJ165DRAFT_1448010 [Panaeolus papilionaceus]
MAALATITRIDDTNRAIIYKGKWATDTSSGGLPVWNHSMTVTQNGDDSAMITFTGNRIAAYALLGKMMPPTLPHLTRYDLDKLAPVTVSVDNSSSIANAAVSTIRLYESPLLEYDVHTLTMTNVKHLNWIWFDFFEVTTLLDQTSLSTSPSVSQVASTATSLPAAECKKESTGTIVGATLGALLAVLLLSNLALFFLWKKKRCSRHTQESRMAQGRSLSN